jgi:hypothetical protein
MPCPFLSSFPPLHFIGPSDPHSSISPRKFVWGLVLKTGDAGEFLFSPENDALWKREEWVDASCSPTLHDIIVVEHLIHVSENVW